MSVGYYMALPGTQLFNSLFDSGKITLDKKYFSHILDSLAIVPSQKYCFNLSKLKLLYYKIYFLFTFYKEKNKSSIKSSIFKKFKFLINLILRKDSHDSKLQTALTNAINSMKDTIRSKRVRWMPKDEEKLLFAEWDKIYRNIRNKKISSGAIEKSPAESTELHKVNVITAIIKEHSTEKRFSISN